MNEGRQSRARPGPPDTHPERGAALVRQQSDLRPPVAIVLGSGLGDVVGSDLEPEHEYEFGSLPGFPPPGVPGHAGRLVLGHLYGTAVAVFLGRVHFYEGHGIGATTLIPRLAAALGIRTLIVTNAAGGLHDWMRPGQLMVIRDHINLIGVNPLAGWRYPDGMPAFVDVTSVYDRSLIELTKGAASRTGIEVLGGVYAAMPGPAYETPAETDMLRTLGADAVGMSTVPEAVAAVALGCSVLGISCITNVAARHPTHEEVLQTARRAAGDLGELLRDVVPALAERGSTSHDG